MSPRTMLPWLLLVSAGCEDPLKEAQLIEEPRILGVRVTTQDDRASLEPGQSAGFEVLVADSDGPVDARLSFELCTSADSWRGVPSCDGEVFAEGSVDLAASPVLVELPSSLPADSKLALLGVACLVGEPRLSSNPASWRCSGADSPLRFSFDVWSRGSAFVNRNPDLSEVRVRVGRVEVPLDAVDTPPSCDTDALDVSRADDHDVEIVLGEAAREPSGTSSSAAHEALQLSHFSTRGSFERHYSFIAGEQRPRVSLAWTAPARESPVKQYLVVRDGRGGVSWVSWSFCAR